MAPVVVDTNVAVVANGSDHPPPGCMSACALRLRGIIHTGSIVVDSAWEIIGEYTRNLRSGGQPGVGDAFLKWVLTNYTNPARCATVALTQHAARTFAEFPDDARLSGFHVSDRKFVAVAVKHGSRPPILQALDSMWWGFRDALEDNGVAVEFLCQDEIAELYARRHGRS